MMFRTLALPYYLAALALLIAANVGIYHTVSATPALTVQVAAAGQGVAALVETPNSRAILIDTGSDASILRTLGTALPPWRRSVDAVVLTGDATRETGGLSFIKGRYRVGTVLRTGTTALPYGAPLDTPDGVSLSVVSPQRETLSYESATFTISSSTPPGTYRADGATFKKN